VRRAIAILCGVAIAAGTAVIAAPAEAVGPPLSDYVIFGNNGVDIGIDSTITGLVGVRNNKPSTGVALRMNGGASIISDPGNGIFGNVRSGGNVRMDTNTLIQGTLLRAVGTTLQKAASATVGADVIGDPELPTLPAPTPIPGGCPTAGPDVGGANNQSRTPVPNVINGDWQFGSNFQLTFNVAGNYYFNSIKTANGAKINAVPGVKIYVCDFAQFGTVDVLPTTLVSADLYLEVQGTDQVNAFRGGGNTDWIGDIFAPNGGIHIGSGGSVASFVGHLHAGGVVDIEHGVNGVGPGGGQTQNPGGVKDATLSHGAKNENNGANLSLWVKNQIAGVVGFDAKLINPAAVQTATLRLTVCYTPGNLTWCPTPSNNWPAAGGRDHVSRLVDGWERWGSGFPNPTNTPPEGNGNNIPIKNNPRGNGAGVTWNCAIDTDIADEGRDCPGSDFWNAGLLTEGPSVQSTTLLTNNMANGTVVDFDVTAFVQQGLGPLDTTFMSFFIRKEPNTGSGEIFYYSNEGAALAGNPAFAPQLIITP